MLAGIVLVLSPCVAWPLATVWAVILLCNVAFTDPREAVDAGVKSAASVRQTKTTLAAEQKLMRELLDDSAPAPNAAIPPGPRGDLQKSIRTG